MLICQRHVVTDCLSDKPLRCLRDYALVYIRSRGSLATTLRVMERGRSATNFGLYPLRILSYVGTFYVLEPHGHRVTHVLVDTV